MCYKNDMKTLLLLAVSCLFFASPSGAQNQAQSLPTVTSFECPAYPAKAKSDHVSGMVRLQVTTDGHQVVQVKALPGHPLLVPDSEKNVRTWKFSDHEPTTLTVTYFYMFEGKYKRDPVTKCDAKLELPTKVTVSADKR